jgi:hypothetical protein
MNTDGETERELKNRKLPCFLLNAVLVKSPISLGEALPRDTKCLPVIYLPLLVKDPQDLISIVITGRFSIWSNSQRFEKY